MALRDIDLKLSYNSRENDVVEEFYIPCFQNSTRYERAVGFFTSEILMAVSCGLHTFLSNKGHMRLICSPKLNEEDIAAMKSGYDKRDAVIYDALMREIDRVPAEIMDDSVNFLSWLISMNKLDIKIALPDHLEWDRYGIYHEKIGLFYDDNDDVIVFSGSNNETLGGIAYNYESFDVFRSWVDPERCSIKSSHFNELWENNAYGVKTYEFPEALRKKIVEKILPQEHPEVGHAGHGSKRSQKKSPREFVDNLWYFQKEAIEAWSKNSSRGIFSMATGTGKTKTSVGAIIDLLSHAPHLFVIVAAPQNTIINQWQEDIDAVDLFKDSIICDSTNAKWAQEFANKIIDFNRNNIKNCVVYTTYNTLSSDQFVKIASTLKNDALLICDEVHWAGANTFQHGLLPIFNYRLGLSATPKRYMDEEGSDIILKYFNDVVYEFSLERALKEINLVTGQTFLCPYNYYPLFVSLNADELEQYIELSNKIKKQYAKEKDSDGTSDYFQRLCEKRQAIIVNAVSKYDALNKLLDSLDRIDYLLVYCSPQQIDGTQDMLNDKGIKNHRFTGEESTMPVAIYNNKSERDYILENFENGSYSALVAMKCLDEGINIPRAEIGILMASSGNPRQYVQRRGRLLRRHRDKKVVNIYDVIVVPYLNAELAKTASKEELKILNKEFVRHEEFASLADNKLEAMNVVFKIKNMYSYYGGEEDRNVTERNK